MATVGNYSLTLADWRARLNPQGIVDQVIETMNETNPILQDMKWAEGNLPTGNMTTQRTALPTVYKRSLNRGVPDSKSRVKQIVDTCTLFEAHSKVDTKLMKLMADPERFRASEDLSFVESFNQSLADNLFYGDSSTDEDTFNGLHVRYNTLTGAKGTVGYQVVSAGGAGSDNTSAWFAAWGDTTVHGIFPKGSQAGLLVEPKGEMMVQDEDGNDFFAYVTKFEWNPGLAVRDLRSIARVANIDVSDLFDASTTADEKKALFEKFILAKNRIRNLNGRVTPAWYVSDTMYSFFESFLSDKNNVYITRQELMGKMPELYLAGYPVRKCDAISEAEATIS
ncbi:MAG: hypothetical protein VB133_08595 [Anaeromusa sp.]|uniref:major capsid protein n=1 Tax=Anaeromusa sp. TaxID=1872520 RepID=UPI002B1FB6D0|nr:hypothetical protein [Anaeromusa sp.]MEA4835179.1 hypothetical protein [Anaeromusa sp.]